MERVTANLTGKPKRVTWNGREFFVAPLSLIVPGVLEGSQGPILYTQEENARDPGAWNGMPLVVGHPTDPEGRHVSGRSPQVIEEWGVGWNFNTAANGKLASEGWFDIEKLRAVDRKLAGQKPGYEPMLARLERGEPLELSTGLYLQEEPSAGEHNGVAYRAIARGYRPDHIAILPDEKGACSNGDGCGVNVNEKQSLWQKLGRLLGITANDKGAPMAAPAKGTANGWFSSGSDWTYQDGYELGRDDAKSGYRGSVPSQYLDRGSDFISGWNAGYREVVSRLDNAKAERVTSMFDRKKATAFLTANCDCWKSKEDQETLNKLTDKQVEQLAANAKVLLVVNAVKKKGLKALTRNADGEGETAGVDIKQLAELFGISTDPGSDPAAFIAELKAKLDEVSAKLGMSAEPAPVTSAECPEGEEMVDGECKPKMAAMSRGTPRRPPTANEWLATAPAEIRSAVKNAMEIERGERARLVERLTANVADDRERQRLANNLLKKPLGELRDLAALLPAPAFGDDQGVFGANWFGAAGGPAFNRADDLEEGPDLEKVREDAIAAVRNQRQKVGGRA